MQVEPPPLLAEPAGGRCALGPKHNADAFYHYFSRHDAAKCPHCGVAVSLGQLYADELDGEVPLTDLMCQGCARASKTDPACARCWGPLDPDTGVCWEGNKHAT